MSRFGPMLPRLTSRSRLSARRLNAVVDAARSYANAAPRGWFYQGRSGMVEAQDRRRVAPLPGLQLTRPAITLIRPLEVMSESVRGVPIGDDLEPIPDAEEIIAETFRSPDTDPLSQCFPVIQIGAGKKLPVFVAAGRYWVAIGFGGVCPPPPQPATIGGRVRDALERMLT